MSMRAFLQQEVSPVWFCLCLCAIVAIACVPLYAAFPYGMIWADTLGYAQQSLAFYVWKPNAMDWRHFPLYSFLIGFASLFQHPTTVLLCINAALFACVLLVVYRLAAALFLSERTGFGVALALLAWEFLLQKTFFFLHVLVADTPFSLLLQLGTLLVVLGWWKQRMYTVYAGFFVLGLSVITKPVSSSYVPLWIGIACLLGVAVAHAVPTQKKRTGMIAAGICIALLTAPLCGWCVRNGLLYDSFRPSAFLFKNLPGRALPYLADNDRILPDARENAEFLRIVREFEKHVGRTLNDYGSLGTINGYTSPLLYLSRFVPGYGTNEVPDHTYFFRFDPFVARVCLAIILHHPRRYATMVFWDYAAMYSPWIPRYIDPDNIHSSRAWYFRQPARRHIPEYLLRTLYPADDGRWPDATQANLQADAFIRLSNPLRAILRDQRIRFGAAILAHVLAGISIVFLWRRGSAALLHRRHDVLLAVITVTLFGNAMFLYFSTVLVEQPLERYQLPGILGLHFLFLLWLLAGLRLLWRMIFTRIFKTTTY